MLRSDREGMGSGNGLMGGWTGKQVNNSRLTHWFILALLIVDPLRPVNTATLFVIHSGCFFPTGSVYQRTPTFSES